MKKHVWNQILFGLVACGLMAPVLPLYGETPEEDPSIAQNGYSYSQPLRAQPQDNTYSNGQPQRQQTQTDNGYTNGNNQALRTQPQDVRKTKIEWQTDYSQALKLAKRQNKPILVYFTGSDWCGWCKKLDSEVLNTSDFNHVAGDKFIFVKLDFPRDGGGSNLTQQNNDLKQKFGVSGFPTIVLLDSNGTFVAETGYRPGGGREFGYYLRQFFPDQQRSDNN